MDDRPPISCYVRTLNEERLIGEVVRAALGAAREVVVVDSGSTDRTVAEAEAAGARVIRQPWLGNGFQKRAAEEACAHDWLLDLDADEVVSPELAAGLRALFAAGEPPRSVYALDVALQPPGRDPWIGFFVVRRAKLYDRRKQRMPAHKAWDQLEGVSPRRLPVIDGPLVHHAFRDFAHIVEKMNRASSVRARETRLRPVWELWLRVLFGLPLYFFRQFFLRGVWREGLYGAAISGLFSLSRWLRDVKQVEIHAQRRRDAKALRAAEGPRSSG